MKLPRLHAFNEALAAVRSRHAASFNLFELKNDNSAKEGATTLLDLLLPRMERWVDKTITVASRADLDGYLGARETVDWQDVNWPSFQALLQYRKRSEVEHDDEWVQVLTCGAQVHGGRSFLSIRRPQRGHPPSDRDNSGRLWQGCHVEQPEGGIVDIQELQRQLLLRLQADLHLGALSTQPQPLGLVWHKEGSERRHLGVVFKVPLEEKVANFLDEKEFRTNGRGHLVKSSFVEPPQLAAGTGTPQGYTLEAWSRAFLTNNWLP
jgi:hypothetical protein